MNSLDDYPTSSFRTAMHYALLKAIQQRAYEQASAGKGKERHAGANESFEDQQICEIARRLRGHQAGGPLYQAVKKCYESGRLPKQRAVAELLGAMNYIAAAILVLEEQEELEEQEVSEEVED